MMTNSAKCPGSSSESFLPSFRHRWDSPTSSLLAALSHGSRLRAVINVEHRTRHASSYWLAGFPLTSKSETTFIGSPVSEIKFIPGREHRWLLTVSKEIWSALTIWDINASPCSRSAPNGLRKPRYFLG